MNNKSIKIKTIITLLLSLTISFVSHAEKYTVVIEPSYPIEQGKKVYEPLQKWLSQKTGLELEFIIDKNYYFYWRNANGDRMPDFTFDAPHIAAFRAIEKNYKAIATKVEPLSFHLISLQDPAKGQSVDEFLYGKRIIMLPTPSIASIYFSNWFTDLFATPTKDVTALSWEEALEIVFDGSADAAIVPNWLVNLYPNFSTLKETPQMPNTTFMASPNTPKVVVDKLQKALLDLIDDEGAYNVLGELNTDGFKKPNITDYNQVIKLISDSI